MKPIGRTRSIPYCSKCASFPLIPAIDIARFGVYYEDLNESLQQAVRDYYNNKESHVGYFNSLVDELNAEYEEAIADYEYRFIEEHKLVEGALLKDG